MKSLIKKLMPRILPIQYAGNSGAPVLHLSFDDGPNAGSFRILEVLARYGVKATFFVVGKRIRGNETALRAVADGGHVIGSHSFEHRHSNELGGAELNADFSKCHMAIREVVPNWTPRLIRPPYGTLSLGLFSMAIRENYRIIMWSRDSIDYRAKTPDDVDANLGTLAHGDILLFHDEFEVTPRALDRLISRDQQQGYEFRPL